MADPTIQLPSYESLSIHVIADAFDSTSPQEAYKTTTHDDGVRLHPVSQSCLTTIPVSSITVTVRALDDWQESWLDAHREVEEDKEYVLLEDRTRRLLRVYGEERPGPSPTCVVRATTQPFVTVGDYVAAVHPWLDSLENDICRAKGVWRGAPLSSDCGIFLDPVQLDHLFTWDANSLKPSDEAKWSSVAKVARDRAGRLAAATAEAFGGEAS
ncbi:hypothetical protein CPLU01_06029 [Colletotrichum plurivorum]|uniref:Uncharacterized protein n=1 Tax=Colletotrichum plurivorum TaxID=2175906 RepID=A0A8H6KJX8_9PEZI|nr:hypothetical protein CPLU01_06029 [Colletotrichum plurivorum]